jgi:hypothetical protein
MKKTIPQTEMKIVMTRTLFIAIAMAIAVTAPIHAHDGHEVPAPLQRSPGYSARLGDGKVSTYVVLSKNKDEKQERKRPVELGIEIPKEVMDSLPSHAEALVVDFPIQARETPFQYMLLDWNPQGHEPVGIYDKPHFDFHFYFQDLDDVNQIDPGPCSGLACDDYAKAMKPVPAEFLPAGYINVGSVVPYMGNHLIDPTSPEFNGQIFTRTWLYGAYDGEITFYEPMITRASLVGEPNQCTALKLPLEYTRSGYYPTKYCTALDAEKKIYRVYITDFVHRTAPAQVQ